MDANDVILVLIVTSVLVGCFLLIGNAFLSRKKTHANSPNEIRRLRGLSAWKKLQLFAFGLAHEDLPPTFSRAHNAFSDATISIAFVFFGVIPGGLFTLMAVLDWLWPS